VPLAQTYLSHARNNGSVMAAGIGGIIGDGDA